MKESKLKNTLHDCLRNRNLMIGLVILLSIIVIAIFADSIGTVPVQQKLGGRDVLKRQVRALVRNG